MGEMPHNGFIDWRPQNGRPFVRDLNPGAHSAAVVVQSRGSQVLNPCTYCVKGRGPFSSCRAGWTPDGKTISKGSCGNCIWSTSASACECRALVPTPNSGLLANVLDSEREGTSAPDTNAQGTPGSVRTPKAPKTKPAKSTPSKSAKKSPKKKQKTILPAVGHRATPHSEGKRLFRSARHQPFRPTNAVGEDLKDWWKSLAPHRECKTDQDYEIMVEARACLTYMTRKVEEALEARESTGDEATSDDGWESD